MARFIETVVIVLAVVATAGCRTSSYAERGAVTGGLVGGLTGAALGHHSDQSADGAFWGGAIGTLIGAAVGDSIDADLAEREAIAAQQAAVQHGPRPASIEDIATMVRSGVGEQVIVNHIRTHGVTAPLTANDIVMLHQQGFSNAIITAMQEASVRRAPPPPPVVIHEHVPPPVCYEPHVYPVHRRSWPRFGWGFSVYR